MKGCSKIDEDDERTKLVADFIDKYGTIRSVNFVIFSFIHFFMGVSKFMR